MNNGYSLRRLAEWLVIGACYLTGTGYGEGVGCQMDLEYACSRAKSGADKYL